MLDLKEPAGRAAFEKLLAASDVFVSNYRTEALTRLELAPEQVAARHPKLVVALITGYGRTGSEDDKMQVRFNPILIRFNPILIRFNPT